MSLSTVGVVIHDSQQVQDIHKGLLAKEQFVIMVGSMIFSQPKRANPSNIS